MSKSAPFSIRLSPRINMMVSEEANRTRRSKGSVIEALADEALRCRRFPGITFRGEDWKRRAWVMGTSLEVFEVIWALEDFGAPKRMADALNITERQIDLALAYYREFPEEINQAIADNRQSLDELQKRFPFVDVPNRRGPSH